MIVCINKQLYLIMLYLLYYLSSNTHKMLDCWNVNLGRIKITTQERALPSPNSLTTPTGRHLNNLDGFSERFQSPSQLNRTFEISKEEYMLLETMEAHSLHKQQDEPSLPVRISRLVIFDRVSR